MCWETVQPLEWSCGPPSACGLGVAADLCLELQRAQGRPAYAVKLKLLRFVVKLYHSSGRRWTSSRSPMQQSKSEPTVGLEVKGHQISQYGLHLGNLSQKARYKAAQLLLKKR